MKNPLHANSKVLIVIALILSIIALSFSLYIFLNSINKDKKSTEIQNSPEERERIQKSEAAIKNDIDTVTNNYIQKKYPSATNISPRVEFVGNNYGIVDFTFINERETVKTKLYLSAKNSTWTVIYESTETISCQKVKELVGENTVLSSYCK